MRKQEINIYTIDELDKKIQEKVIEKYRGNMVDYPFLDENLVELCDELLKENKITIINEKFGIGYSLSNCQGDGFYFEGKFEWQGYNVYIVHINHHYNHKRSVEIDIRTEEDGDVSQNIYSEFQTIYDGICDKCEKEGYAHIKEEENEENIIETLRENEYEYLADGMVWK